MRRMAASTFERIVPNGEKAVNFNYLFNQLLTKDIRNSSWLLLEWQKPEEDDSRKDANHANFGRTIKIFLCELGVLAR